MSGRGRCWLCGRLLDQEDARVCQPCAAEARGLCARCDARRTCADLYRETVERRREAGLQDPPRFPPCCRQLEPGVVPPPWLLRLQLRQYGGAYCGPGALYLAAADAEAQPVVVVHELARELADAWGARWRRAA